MEHETQSVQFLPQEEGTMPPLTDEGYCTTSSDDATPDCNLDRVTPFTLSSSLDPRPLVAVIGVGYVGLHLVTAFSSAYDVVAYDISRHRIRFLQQQHGKKGRVTFTSHAEDLSPATHFLISVPTLLLPDKTIDSSALEDAVELIGSYARPGSTVVVESSVAVGMTRQLLGPLAARRNLFAGMSPERVDPGRTDPPPQAIPKIVSGLDDIVAGSLTAIISLYSAVFKTVVPVSSPEVAEMVKLYENCQRMVCIAYANEMADACIPHGIDPFEVCSAAASKPFGYMPFTPGVGVGGHCIPVNPYYLHVNNDFPLLQSATEFMEQRPATIACRLLANLCATTPQSQDTSTPRPTVLVVGMGFKRGQSSLSNSPGLKLAETLQESELVEVLFADKLVSQDSIPGIKKLPDAKWNTETLDTFSMIVVVFKQTGMDFGVLDHLCRARVEIYG